MNLRKTNLVLLLTIISFSFPTFACTIARTGLLSSLFDKNKVPQILPTKNSEFEIVYDGISNLTVVFKDSSQINALTVVGGGPFPGNFGIVANDEFNVGTGTSIMKFKVSDGKVMMVQGYDIHSQPNFSGWIFSANGRYAVGIYKNSTEGYQQIFLFDFQSLHLNKGSSLAFLNNPDDPIESISISNSGAVIALSKRGENLPLAD